MNGFNLMCEWIVALVMGGAIDLAVEFTEDLAIVRFRFPGAPGELLPVAWENDDDDDVANGAGGVNGAGVRELRAGGGGSEAAARGPDGAGPRALDAEHADRDRQLALAALIEREYRCERCHGSMATTLFDSRFVCARCRRVLEERLVRHG